MYTQTDDQHVKPNAKSKWVDAGYDLFGNLGTAAFNVERLSMIVTLSRSSFYHHFSDMEIYEIALFNRHIDNYKLMSAKVDVCQTFDPDLLHIVKEFKSSMAFQRQLLINESSPRFKACFDSARVLIEDRVYDLWRNYIGDDTNRAKGFSLFETVRDYFLIHYDQNNDDDIKATIQDIQMLLHGRESVQ